MLAQIQAYLRGSASSGREVDRIGPFLATVTAINANPWLNYAIPDDGAEPSAQDVAALTVHYQKRNRQPRLEYLATAAPAVERALAALGYVVEHRLALMLCEPRDLRELPSPEDVSIAVARGDGDMVAVRRVQQEGYGELEPPSPAEIESLAASIARGGLAVVARLGDEAIGAGEFTRPQGGLAEVTSVAVRPPYRRRGVAGALASALTGAAFEAGVATAFLMAEAEVARVYARAGYRAVGEVLAISLP